MIKRLSILSMLLIANLVVSQRDLSQIMTDNTRPQKENILLQLIDDQEREALLGVTVIKGTRNGPVFTIIAGVHGYEYPPIMATQELMQELDAEKLTGTLIIVPVANTGSFFTRTPFINPKDKVNLNNAFPGNSEGSITQMIARYITDQIIPVTDVFLDIHGGDACEDLLPFVCYYDNQKKPRQTALAKQLSETSGFEYVVSYPYTISDEEPAKYAFKQAVQDGKTGLSIECGKLGNVQEESVRLIKTGVYNMLQEMEMYNNGTGPSPSLVRLNGQTYIDSSENGIFYTSFKAGDKVNAGDTVGHTTDLFGNVLEEYKAPVSGTVLYMLATPPINNGDTVMCIGSVGAE